MSNLVKVGEVKPFYNAAGTRVLRYTVEISHTGLNEHKLISAPESYMLQNKANMQIEKWSEKWSLLEAKRKRNEDKEANFEEAERQTKEAEQALNDIANLLIHSMSIDNSISWETLKSTEPFPDKIPDKPVKPTYKPCSSMPSKSNDPFVPKFSFFEKLITSLKNKKIAFHDQLYNDAVSKWEDEKVATEKANKQIDSEYEVSIATWKSEVSQWESKKAVFLSKQADHNVKIDQMHKDYLSKNPDLITEYCEMVLNNSHYPDSFPKDFEIEYNPENRIIIIEYQLPSLEGMPKVKEVKYIASKNELKESFISESQQAKMFDECMFSIALRTIHELFEADKATALDAISFNGWVKAINKATGKEENNCILSLQVKKEEFRQIDLRNVDPKTCFRNLKGVSGSRLSSLTPIQPILQINRNDKRFIEGYAVADGLDTSTNLAAMDWEDFEHLIREVFEKEFKATGGEVKVTQASRDGGVDAVAFDPDPIRGGKIVIQAKRYTNTVGVSAVRDLYGTVMNEGATKGILVSTANYGPDAYEFAKGKPLTLLNGSNLLHLLEKHGHHAKIDLREAKKIIAEREAEQQH